MTKIERPQLNCTCLRLRQASRRVSQIYDQHLKVSGIRNTQFSTLANLELGNLSMNDLADALMMDPTTLNRTLKPLLESGLILVRVGDDRRERIVSITKKGLDVLEKAKPRWVNAQRAIRTAMGRERRDKLHLLLQDVGSIDPVL